MKKLCKFNGWLPNRRWVVKGTTQGAQETPRVPKMEPNKTQNIQKTYPNENDQIIQVAGRTVGRSPLSVSDNIFCTSGAFGFDETHGRELEWLHPRAVEKI